MIVQGTKGKGGSKFFIMVLAKDEFVLFQLLSAKIIRLREIYVTVIRTSMMLMVHGCTIGANHAKNADSLEMLRSQPL